MMAPVGQASRHPARTQCLQTSDSMSQRPGCSTKATWRQVEAESSSVLSYDAPLKTKPSSGSWFHCLQATSQALQPMQTVVSVKNPVGTGSGFLALHTSGGDDAVLTRHFVPGGGEIAPPRLGWMRQGLCSFAAARLDIAGEGFRLLD